MKTCLKRQNLSIYPLKLKLKAKNVVTTPARAFMARYVLDDFVSKTFSTSLFLVNFETVLMGMFTESRVILA